MPKVPAGCLITGSSNEPASRPDASRDCADHPEAGQDPSDPSKDLTTSEASTWCADHKCKKGSTRHADRSIKQACLCREVSTDHETHGRRSGGYGRAEVLISARGASVGDVQVHPGDRSRTREAHSHPYSGWLPEQGRRRARKLVSTADHAQHVSEHAVHKRTVRNQTAHGVP